MRRSASASLPRITSALAVSGGGERRHAAESPSAFHLTRLLLLLEFPLGCSAPKHRTQALVCHGRHRYGYICGFHTSHQAWHCTSITHHFPSWPLLPSSRWRTDRRCFTDTRDDQETLQNKLINEEYKIWKKNSVFLYDVMYRYAPHAMRASSTWLISITAVPSTGPRSPRNGCPT